MVGRVSISASGRYGLLSGLEPEQHGAAFDVPMVPADPAAPPAGGDGGPRRRASWRSPVAKRVAGSGRVMLRPPVCPRSPKL